MRVRVRACARAFVVHARVRECASVPCVGVAFFFMRTCACYQPHIARSRKVERDGRAAVGRSADEGRPHSSIAWRDADDERWNGSISGLRIVGAAAPLACIHPSAARLGYVRDYVQRVPSPGVPSRVIIKGAILSTIPQRRGGAGAAGDGMSAPKTTSTVNSRATRCRDLQVVKLRGGRREGQVRSAVDADLIGPQRRFGCQPPATEPVVRVSAV